MKETLDEALPVGCADTTPRDRRNQLRFLAAITLWAVSFLAVTYAVKHELVTPGPLGWLVAAVPSAVAVVVMIVYGRYLSQADELQRMIQLKALGLGFGAGWVAICGYPLFERLGAPAADAGDYFLVMTVFFALGNLIGWKRYR